MGPPRVIVLAALPLALACGACAASSPGRNGEISKPAAQVLQDAAAALRDVHSVRVGGSGTFAKQHGAFSFALAPPNKSVAIDVGGASLHVVLVGQFSYVEANAAFYRQQRATAGVVQLLADRWLRAPASAAQFGGLANGLDLATLSRCLVENHGTLTTGGQTTVQGQPSMVILDKGDTPGATPSKLFVATTGPPLPLRLLALGPQRPGGVRDAQCNDTSSPTSKGDELSFSLYDRAPSITAPKGAIDSTKLSGG